jgi:N-acetylglucosamine-6-phosphate deacetylase
MSEILLKNVRIVAPVEDGLQDVLVEGGKLKGIGEGLAKAARVIDLEGATLLPGFIDIHNHGAAGVDVNSADAEALLRAAEFLFVNGVTAWIPTIVPDTDENYGRIIAEIDRLMEMQQGRAAAQAVGVHYEGVFANEVMCGALRPYHFKRFTGSEATMLPRLKSGVHMTTLAPEIENGVVLIAEFVRLGWVVAIGHTKAEPEVLDAAFEAGARHLTHFFNAMSGLHHRNKGVVGWGLANEAAAFDIIADGIHVHPEMLKLAVDLKGAGSVSLISDSVAPTGLGDGEYELWGEKIFVKEGRTENERGSIAGSVITMLDAVTTVRGLGFSFHEIAQMASENPARVLGLDDTTGSIAVGKRADLVALDEAGDVKMVMASGVLSDM